MKSESFTRAGGRWLAAVNIDQRRSRSSPDRVPELLADLSSLDVLLGPERTVGDEVQLLTSSAAAVGHLLETVARGQDWRVGIGLGPVETPLPTSVREARGPAFLAAREAIQTAHSSPTNLALVAAPGRVGVDDYAVGERDARRARRVTEANVVASLLQHLWSRRTQEGWDVIDQLRRSGTGRAAAERLDISASAVSQRLRTAGWQPGEQGRELLESLLDEALTGGEAS